MGDRTALLKQSMGKKSTADKPAEANIGNIATARTSTKRRARKHA